ncbi:MAG: FAD binding domain-containing protein [Betaproteobacteria bacterium]
MSLLKLGYVVPETLEEASGFLREHAGQAVAVAGGTDVLVQLRRQARHGSRSDLRWLVDVSRIRGLSGVCTGAGTITIGALTVHEEIARNPIVRKGARLLAEACASVGSPQVRARGTIGGNIMNASPAADTIPALVALSARVRLSDVGSTRDVLITDVFDGPYKNRAVPGEVLVNVYFDALPPACGCAFVKLGRREALAIARLSCAAVIERDEAGRVVRAAIVPGACLPMPARVSSAEEILVGSIPDHAVVAAAAREVAQEMVRRTGVRWSTDYKKPALEAVARRAIWQALGVNVE